jgi:hypothetical protein
VTVTSGSPRRRRADALALALIVLIPMALAGATLLAGRAWSPAGNLLSSYPWQGLGAPPTAPMPALTDVAQWFHPVLLWSGSEIRSGRFPLWVPHAYAGAPFFANPQTALLFPLTWVAWVLPAAAALTLVTALKLVGAALALYWFLRSGLQVGVTAALVGALGYGFSTTLVGWVGWAFGSSIMLLPLLFGAVERARTPGRRPVAVLALVVALHVLAGYPQATLHALLAAAAWALARAPAADRAFLVRAAGGVLLGVVLAAAQLLPFLEYARESAVLAYRRQWLAALAAPPEAAITLLLPYAFGSGADAWGRWQFSIVSTYAGLVPLLLAPLGVVDGWRRPGSRFFTGLVVVTAAMHYGLPGGGALAALPGLSLGANLRLMPFLVLGVCVLGALGVDALARRTAGPRLWPVRVAFVTLALAALGWVATALPRPGAQGLALALDLQLGLALTGLTAAALVALRWRATGAAAWGVALVALQVLSVVPPAAAYLPSVQARWLYPDAPSLAWLRARADHARVLMPGHVGLLYGLAEAHGYDGLTPRRIAELVGSLGTGTAIVHGYVQSPLEGVGSEALSPAAVLTSPVVDLLGVRYVMMPPGAAPPWPQLQPAYDGADARVFVNARALPRAFLAFRGRCADDATALRLLRGQALPLREEVLLADCAAPPASGPPDGAARVELQAHEPGLVRIVTDAAAPGWLVLTDTWFPGWRAWRDGVETRLWRADHAFRAVWVPPGRHEIEMRYQPASLRLGGVLSGLGVVGVVALGWTRRRAPA